MFEQAKLKVMWSRHMLGQVELGVKRFSDNQPYTIRCHHNRETKELAVSHQGQPGDVPADVVMIAGAIVQTLRSCLDYITSEIWNAAKETDTRLHFPIAEDKAQLELSAAFLKIQKFRPKFADFILNEIKPTKADNFPIWAVNRLANTDKHRNLLLVAQWGGFEIDEIKRRDGVEMAKTRFSAPASDDKGVFLIPEVEEYTDPKGIVEIRFQEADIIRTGVFDRREIVSTLAGLQHAVAETIDRTEDFFAR